MLLWPRCQADCEYHLDQALLALCPFHPAGRSDWLKFLVRTIGEALNARTWVRAQRALLLSVEDTLLITGIAIYAAVRAHSCSVTMYHFKLLCWLFVVLISNCSAIYRTGQMAIWYQLKELTKQRLASAPSTVAPPARWRRYVLYVRGNFMLLLVILMSMYLWTFALRRSPDFPQPAIAGPAHCFMAGSGARRYYASLQRERKPLAVAFLGALAPSLSLGFAHSVVFGLSFVRADISSEGDSDEINERDTPKKRLLRRLQAVEGLIYVACNITGIVFAFKERNKAKKYIDPTSSEREWAFGQIVALVLLGTPLLAFIEVLTGKCSSDFLSALGHYQSLDEPDFFDPHSLIPSSSAGRGGDVDS